MAIERIGEDRIELPIGNRETGGGDDDEEKVNVTGVPWNAFRNWSQSSAGEGTVAGTLMVAIDEMLSF